MSIEVGSAETDRKLKRPAPLRESVYEALTEMIIAGSLEPGQHLVEVHLASMLGVSRQPIREALQRLRNEGWVDMRPGFGATVHIPDEDEVDQLLAHGPLWRASPPDSPPAVPPGKRSRPFGACVRRGPTFWSKVGDIDGAVRANAEFHRLVSEVSGNRYLTDFTAQVDRRVRWYYTPVAERRGQASSARARPGDQGDAGRRRREGREGDARAYRAQPDAATTRACRLRGSSS